MALVNPTPTASFDQSAVYKLDLSEVLASILLDDTDFLSTIGISSDVATQTKHQWVEDALNATTALQSGGTSAQQALGTTSGTNLRLSSSNITRSKITAGTLLKDALSGKTEIVQVTAVSSTSATVVRGYGGMSALRGASGQTHLAGATWEIVANPRPQGMAGPADESTTRALKHNFTQIFSKGVVITGTAVAIDHAGVGKEDAYQIDLRLRELKRELDRAVIMGARASGDVTGTVYGTMGGVIDWVGSFIAT